MIRIAAVGDVHYDRHSRAELKAHFESLNDRADLFLIAGDLTQAGTLEEAKALANDLAGVRVPIISVLGNHDFHSERQEEIARLLRDCGVTALEGATATFRIRDLNVGIAGLKGFGGGFFGACVTEFGEPETKRFAHHAKRQAEILKTALLSLDTDFRIALLHFSPCEATLLGERRELYPFLGSYLLAEALDQAGADGCFHGHAHHGVERGATPGGIPVRNVALPVIRHAYNVYTFEAPIRSRRAAAPAIAAALDSPAPLPHI